jgi:hypothetical protein
VQRASYASDMTERQLLTDAKEPLRVEWFNDSDVEVPVSQ